MTTTTPLDGMVPPNPDAAPAGKPAKKASKRPTTRAGRAAAAAAKKAGATPDTAPKASPAPRPRKADLETRLAGTLTTLGLGVAAAGGMTSPAIQRDGIIIITNAPPVAKALADIAAGNPAVARNLERVLTAGTYAALAGAVMPLAIAIAANHGVISEDLAKMVGVELPDLATVAGAPGTPSPAPGAPAPGSVPLG